MTARGWWPHRQNWYFALAVTVSGAALTEFLLLRVGLRLGATIGNTPWIIPITQVATFIGSTAMNLAILAAGLLAVLVLIEQRPLQNRGVQFAATGLLWHLGIAVASLSNPTTGPGAGWGPWVLALSSVSACTVIIPVTAKATKDRRWYSGTTILLLLIAGALLALHTAHGAQALTMLGVRVPARLTVTALFFAEILAIAAALQAPFARWVMPADLPSSASRASAIAAGVAAGLFVGGFLYINPWLARTISIWTIFFVAFLPPWLYALAAGSWVYALARLWRAALAGRDATSLRAASGLTIIAVGGLKPDYSYFALLGLVGVILLAHAAISGSNPLEASPTAEEK